METLSRPAARPRHVCAFARDAADLERSFAAFLEEGERRGERSLLIGDPDRPGCRGWDEFHVREGRFHADTALAFTAEWLKQRRTRCVHHMGWARHVERREVLRYEEGLNAVLSGRPDLLVCVYDVRTPVATAAEALRRHPFVLVGGEISPNPFFIP